MKRVYEVELGIMGGRGWHQVSFWRWLWMRTIYVTRVRYIQKAAKKIGGCGDIELED